MGIGREGIVCMRSGWDVGDEEIWKEMGGKINWGFRSQPWGDGRGLTSAAKMTWLRCSECELVDTAWRMCWLGSYSVCCARRCWGDGFVIKRLFGDQ